MGTERLAELYPHAVSHLSSVDEDWSRLIKHVDPCMHRSRPAREPYEALIRAVAYQQLHARAADAIIARFLDLYPDSGSEIVFPSPDEILATRTEDLRSCGFSSRKIATVQRIDAQRLGNVSRGVPAENRHTSYCVRTQDLPEDVS